MKVLSVLAFCSVGLFGVAACSSSSTSSTCGFTLANGTYSNTLTKTGGDPQCPAGRTSDTTISDDTDSGTSDDAGTASSCAPKVSGCTVTFDCTESEPGATTRITGSGTLTANNTVSGTVTTVTQVLVSGATQTLTCSYSFALTKK
jgi:hypothetical protein